MSDINLDNPTASVSGAALIQQRCRLRILRWRGSWVINPDKGIDYLSGDVDTVAEDLLLELREVTGVTNVTLTRADRATGTIDLSIFIDAPTGTDEPVTVETENFQFVLTYQEWNNAV